MIKNSNLLTLALSKYDSISLKVFALPVSTRPKIGVLLSVVVWIKVQFPASFTLMKWTLWTPFSLATSFLGSSVANTFCVGKHNSIISIENKIRLINILFLIFFDIQQSKNRCRMNLSLNRLNLTELAKMGIYTFLFTVLIMIIIKIKKLFLIK